MHYTYILWVFLQTWKGAGYSMQEMASEPAPLWKTQQERPLIAPLRWWWQSALFPLICLCSPLLFLSFFHGLEFLCTFIFSCFSIIFPISESSPFAGILFFSYLFLLFCHFMIKLSPFVYGRAIQLLYIILEATFLESYRPQGQPFPGFLAVALNINTYLKFHFIHEPVE